MQREYDIIGGVDFMYRITMPEEEAQQRQSWSDADRKGYYKYFPVVAGEYDRDQVVGALYGV